jgi:type IV pilus assembly protein PilP
MKRLLMITLSATLLAGCFDDLTDIKAYMKKVEVDTPAGIAPIPEVKEFAHVKYAGSTMRSPFAKPKAEAIQDKMAQMQDCLQPQRQRQKEPLEKYALTNLRMKGTMGYDKDPWALVEAASDGSLHRVSIGNFMGLFHGRITAVLDDQVQLLELVPDGTGCWKERETMVNMSESEDAQGDS